MNDDISPRLAAMREALVAEVEATPTTARPRRRPRPSRGTVLAVVAAFLVGGGLTGGLAAAALPAADPDAALQTALATTARYMVEDTNHGRVLGTPTFRVVHGDTTVTLGDRPAGADRVTTAWACLEGDDPTVSVDGEQTTGMLCGPRGDASSEPYGWGLSVAPSSGSTTVTVSAGDDDRYALWVAWAKAPTIAAPSPQQDAETADGVVTQAEYTTAFNRLAACTAQAGFPMSDVPLTWYDDGLWTSTPTASGPWYLYSTPSEGVEVFDTACYPREFEQVDTIWQQEHPMPVDPPVEPSTG